MICTAKRNNVLNGVLHYAGDAIELEAVPNDNWQGTEATSEGQGSLEDMTVAQLKDLAAARDIETTSRTTKSELLELLG